MSVDKMENSVKREKTLLVEYKQRNKANMFIDKRFGEYDENLSLEEKMLKRFATEKQKHHEKAALFNLEDEDLTHFGQSLEDIKQFDNPRLSDEESGKEDDQLEENHFGGFLKRKGSAEEKDDDKPKSKKEIMEEVIANAKLKKHERQVFKEESEIMRQKLDASLAGIRDLLKFRPDATDLESKSKTDDYDKTVREMAFEMKAKASDKLKTVEQIAKLEKEKLKKLEEERIRRMKGLPLQEKKPMHRSADELVDDYIVDTDKRSLLTYEDGKMVMPDGYSSGEASETDIVETGVKKREMPEEGNEEEDESEEEAENDSDLESSDNESSDSVVGQPDSTSNSKPKESLPTKDHSVQPVSSQAAKNELPYTFDAPNTYEEFTELINERSCTDVLTIVERILKCNHPKLNPANKAKMETFFGILMQYIDKVAAKNPPEITAIDGLVSHLFNLTQHSPLHAAKSMQGLLKGIQKEFCAMSKTRKIPSLKMILYLRIVSLLFPTSDFRHGVCTPALIFMSQILAQITVHTVQDASIGLFVCTLVYEFVRTSKRYVPEVINYFVGILYLSSEKIEPAGKVFPPFKARSKHKNILKISSSLTANTCVKRLSLTKVFTPNLVDEDGDTSRVAALWTCLILLKKFISLYSELVSFPEIFEPVVFHLKRIKISNYSHSVQTLYGEILNAVTSHVSKRQPLTLQKRRPTPIQMFEPKFEENYEVKRKSSSRNKIVNERQKLRYKYKKELKGALREIRKDSQFLARQQLQEQLERDAERARKTKEIQSLLSNQQAEANALNRKKRKLRG